MENISTALSVNQSLYQSELGLLAIKLAAGSQRQVADMLAQAAQAAQTLAVNPAHLGGNLDTYA